MSEIKVGVAGLTHGHVWGLIDQWKKVSGARLIAVADETPLLDKAKPSFKRSFKDWRKMLGQEQIDALLITSNNVESSAIACEALAQGIPCMVEKPMAASAKDADAMLKAMESSQKLLMINWPIALNPTLLEIKKRIDAGEIGEPFHFRYRTGHRGPKEIGCDEYFVGWLYDEMLNGGGAIGDFCCYGAALARWLIGMPLGAYCVRGNWTKDYAVSDDHAVCLLRFPKGSAELEGTWATNGMDRGPSTVVHGKNGTLAVEGRKLLKYTDGSEPVELETPDPPIPNHAEYFAHCLASGRMPEGILDPYIAADACRILDAARASSSSRKEEAVAHRAK